MYKRVMVVFAPSDAGLKTLHEGALLAKHCNASIFVLGLISETTTMKVAQYYYPGLFSEVAKGCREFIQDGIASLLDLGLTAKSKVAFGDPVRETIRHAQAYGADLIVIPHEYPGGGPHWFAGHPAAKLGALVGCSVMVSRNDVMRAESRMRLKAAIRG